MAPRSVKGFSPKVRPELRLCLRVVSLHGNGSVRLLQGPRAHGAPLRRFKARPVYGLHVGYNRSDPPASRISQNPQKVINGSSYQSCFRPCTSEPESTNPSAMSSKAAETSPSGPKSSRSLQSPPVSNRGKEVSSQISKSSSSWKHSPKEGLCVSTFVCFLE